MQKQKLYNIFHLFSQFPIPLSNIIQKHTIKNRRNKHKIIKTEKMGNLSSLSIEQNQQVTNLRINLDFKKPVLDELKQLTNWSLEQIRQIYVPFRKRKGSPIMSRSEFLRFIGLSRITSFYIYDKMKNASAINVFEILAILTLTAYATKNHKVQFLFNVFDLESDKIIMFRQLVLMFTSIIRGYAIITGQPLPDSINVQKYARTLFSRADLNNDQSLQIGEILGWFQSHIQSTNLFNRFQPNFLGKQSYHIFNSFPPYTQAETEVILQRLNKIYHNEELLEDDYKILTHVSKESQQKGSKESVFYDEFLFSKTEQNKFFQSRLVSEEKKFKSKESNSSTGLKSRTSLHKDPKYKMPKINQFHTKSNQTLLKHNRSLQNDHLVQKSIADSKITKKAFHNIIIIKGRTITKKEVFDLRDYFDKISNGKRAIFIEDFLESFNQQKYNHMKSVAASLYNFLDRKQNGKVTFEELVLKLYPDLTKQHLKLIETWSEQYNTSFNLDKKIKANRQQQEHKKRMLPKSCVARFKEMYFLFDREKKGFVTFDDLKRVLCEVSTQKQLLQTFEDCDKDKDGKLSFQEFSHIILPPDLQIQGLS